MISAQRAYRDPEFLGSIVVSQPRRLEIKMLLVAKATSHEHVLAPFSPSSGRRAGDEGR